MKLLFKLFIFSIALFISFNSSATHVVGGQIETRWISGDNFEITLRYYRDCNSGNAPLPADARVCMYDQVTNTLINSYLMPLDSNPILTLGDQCYTPPGLCVQMGVYKQTVSIANNPNGYYLMYQEFARNNIITNIVNPGGTGMTYYAEIPNSALHNSSPTFNTYPKAYFCGTFPNYEDLSATDIDGDVLKYYIEVPYKEKTATSSGQNLCASKPYTNVSWSTGHSFPGAILGTGSTLSIDSNTGLLFAQTPNAGVYVFAIRVEEWRNGIKIGEIRRDIQYTVLNCSPNLPPLFTTEPGYNNYTIAAGEELCFDISLTDFNIAFGTQPADGVYFTYESVMLDPISNAPKATITLNPVDSVSAPDTASIKVCIKTQCDQIRPEPYRLTIHGNDTSCYGINTIDYTLDLLVVLPGIVDLYPNIFTPNGDKKNDTFKTNAEDFYCYDEFEVTIYNRWGNEIFASTNFDFEWNGKTKSGKDAEDGVYYYTLKSKFQETANEERGFVHLIR